MRVHVGCVLGSLSSLLPLACSSLPARGRDRASVRIGQPEVFRRERSLVERFEDLEWLRAQRSPEKEQDYEQGFQGSSRSATAELFRSSGRAQIGQPPDASSGGSSGSPGSTSPTWLTQPDAKFEAALESLNAAKPTTSPRDKLMNRLAFRDTAAVEIQKRSLDDTHDLDGMALYELQFNLSLEPGANAGDAYAVMFSIHQPEIPSLLQFQRRLVTQAMRDEGVALLEETVARLDQDSLSVADSLVVKDAMLRGAIAAQHEGMMAVVQSLRLAFPNMDVLRWEQQMLTWTTGKNDHAIPESIRNHVITCDDTQVLKSSAATWSEATTTVLRAFSERAPRPTPVEMTADSMMQFLHIPFATTATAPREQVEKIEARVMTLPSEDVHVDPLPDESVRGTADTGKLWQLVAALVKEPLAADRLAELTRLALKPDRDAAMRYARQALGFVVCQRLADCSGNALKYQKGNEVPGLDGRLLVPLMLADNLEEKSGPWEPPQQQLAHVVSVSPNEVSEQISTSAYSDLQSAFSLALAGVFSGTITSANADFDMASRELRRYELINRNPLLVGFVGADLPSAPGSNTFGWVLGPRLETSTKGTAELRYRHVSASHAVTATLVAPAQLRQLSFDCAVYRINNWGAWDQTPVRNSIEVRLPADVTAVAQAMLQHGGWDTGRPRVLVARSSGKGTDSTATLAKTPVARLRAKEKAGLTILGSNLWRNPQVFVGGQRATRVQILADLGGIWAEFDQVRAPAADDAKGTFVDLIVSTSRGTDRIINGVEILPPKDERKPDPELKPSVQVLASTPQGNAYKVDLAFDLVPPLPPAWNELRLRARIKGMSGFFKDAAIEPRNLSLRPTPPGGIELRQVELDKGSAWGPVEVVEISLQLRDTPGADPHDLHPKPAQVVLVRQPIECSATVAVVKVDGNWVLKDPTVRLVLATPIDPAHLSLMLPDVKPAAAISTKVTVANQLVTVSLATKPEEFGKAWLAAFAKETVFGSGNTPPPALDIEFDLGKARLKARFQFEGK